MMLISRATGEEVYFGSAGDGGLGEPCEALEKGGNSGRERLAQDRPSPPTVRPLAPLEYPSQRLQISSLVL